MPTLGEKPQSLCMYSPKRKTNCAPWKPGEIEGVVICFSSNIWNSPYLPEFAFWCNSEVERELGLLFSKGGNRRSGIGNQSKQPRGGTKFQMLVEDIRDGVLVCTQLRHTKHTHEVVANFFVACFIQTFCNMKASENIKALRFLCFHLFWNMIALLNAN